MMTLQFALAAMLAPAQAPAAPADVDIRVGPRRPPIDEQVEVMRALLARKLGRGAPPESLYGWTYGQPQSTASAAQPSVPTDGSPFAEQLAARGALASSYSRASPAAAAVEGAYLDGYGAVFTVTLPATGQDPRPAADPTKASPAMSEWDRLQRQLRGEPVPEQLAAPAKDRPVGDVVLRTLAENGKHLAGLKDDERVTVVVVFRGAHTARVAAGNYGVPATSGTMGITGQGGYSGSASFAPAVPQAARDEELLGDLHLKQGQPQTAIEAFTKAVKQAEAGGKDPRLADLYTKLAQAEMAAGNLDEARAAFEKVRDLRRKTGTTAGRANTAAPAATPLPARLTVVATKRVLDQVGAGKMTFDEFRKEAKVDYVPAGGAGG